MKQVEAHLRCAPFTVKPFSRTGTESWFPYYAGYSAQFVREALTGLGARPGWTILDPWNGAGTTTSVADSLGCDAIGYDINPVAALVAAARLARSDDATHSFGLASEFLAVADRAPASVLPTDPLREWISPRLTTRYRNIEAAILDLLGSRAGSRIRLECTAPPPLAAFFLLCLMRAAKRFARLKDTSNPTWTTPEKRGDSKPAKLDAAFLDVVGQSIRDAETDRSFRGSERVPTSTVRLGDARALQLADESIDAVVTSPPYCTRIDYFRATLFELAAVSISSDSEQYRDLRENAMGTNLMRSGTADPLLSGFPREVRGLLERIRSHPSKASGTYYLRSYAQYFDDASRSLHEVRRVLKRDSCAIFVVQSSYYKEIPVPLGDLYSRLARQVGLRARTLQRIPVRRVLTTINTRANLHERERAYTEDIVCLQKAE